MTTTQTTERVILPMGVESIIFEFSFSPEDPLTPPYTPSSPPESDVIAHDLEEGLSVQTQNDNIPKMAYPYVQCLIYRSDVPEEYFLWSGTLELSPPVCFELCYEDNENIRGEFRQFQNTALGLYYVFFEVEYGEDYDYHYEGNMVEIPYPTN